MSEKRYRALIVSGQSGSGRGVYRIMLVKKEWQIEHDTSEQGDILEWLLAARHIVSERDRHLYFEGTLEDLHDPFLLPDMEKACGLLADTLAKGDRVLIHGDYDADGLTSAALMLHVLTALGFSCEAYIPDRISDGYGLSDNSLEAIETLDCQLLLTVDCGISSFDQIETLKKNGMKVIITDHHECPSRLPAADAVINPKRSDSQYPFRELAGVGVACKLLQAFCDFSDAQPLWKQYLDLVALGTVADVVSMLDENRILVRYGLDRLNQEPTAGIACMLDLLNMKSRTITEQTLGYILGPRLNASGRLGNAEVSLKLLMAKQIESATEYARCLNQYNIERQTIESQLVDEASAEIEKQTDWMSESILVAAGDGWHVGVLGIAAARLTEKYCRPVLVLSGDDQVYQGSGRSYDDFNLLGVLRQSEKFLIQYGGHIKAAGLKIGRSDLDAFRLHIQQIAREIKAPESYRAVLKADRVICETDLTYALAKRLARTAPYGEDNQQPVWVVQNLKLVSMHPAGNGRHLKIRLKLPRTGQLINAIAFGFGDADEIFQVQDLVDVMFSLEINVWQQKENLQLNIKDMHLSKTGDLLTDEPWIAETQYQMQPDIMQIAAMLNVPAERLIPAASDYKIVYQTIHNQFKFKPFMADLSLLARKISKSYQIDMTMFRLSRVLNVFEETGIVSMKLMGKDRVKMVLCSIDKKVKLEESQAYQRLQLKGS